MGFIEGKTRDDLDREPLLVHGLIRCVEVVGEAASQVSPAGRARFPTIPWRTAIGMRHRLIHSYFEVDLDLVRKTVSLELRPLVDVILASGAMDWTEDNEADGNA